MWGFWSLRTGWLGGCCCRWFWEGGGGGFTVGVLVVEIAIENSEGGAFLILGCIESLGSWELGVGSC